MVLGAGCIMTRNSATPWWQQHRLTVCVGYVDTKADPRGACEGCRQARRRSQCCCHSRCCCRCCPPANMGPTTRCMLPVGQAAAAAGAVPACMAAAGGCDRMPCWLLSVSSSSCRALRAPAAQRCGDGGGLPRRPGRCWPWSCLGLLRASGLQGRGGAGGAGGCECTARV
jgi:hypothetical protein